MTTFAPFSSVRRRAIEINPSYDVAYDNRGVAYCSKGDYGVCTLLCGSSTGCVPPHSSSSYRTSDTYTSYAYLPSPTSFRTCTNRQGSNLARNALLLSGWHTRWSLMDRTGPDPDPET